ncbi:MAG: DUF5309 domain-containing protein [Planctomycetota bacterium]|nr:DUF5309 domain-containing protein [Planctomycetota bacterium]
MSLGSFAQALAEQRIAKWLLENYPDKLQFALTLPVRYVDGQSLLFNSLDDPTGGPIAPAVPIGDCAPYTDQSFNSWEQRKFSFGLPSTLYQSCESALAIYTTTLNDVDEVQFAKACRRCLMEGLRLLEGGVAGNPGEFDGLRSLVPAPMTVTVGGVPTLDQFDEAFFKVVDNEGYPNAVMARTGSVKRYLKLRRDAGLDEQYVEIDVPDPRMGTRKALWPSIHGVPFYINDSMQPGPEGEENVYFMVMGDNGHHTPGHGLTLIIPQVRRYDMFIKRVLPITPGDPATLNSTATAAVLWPMGIAYGSAGAVSRLADITPL